MEADKEATQLLPCAFFNHHENGHQWNCPAFYRTAVTERLRQRDERIAALEAENDRLRALIEEYRADSRFSGERDERARAALAGRGK